MNETDEEQTPPTGFELTVLVALTVAAVAGVLGVYAAAVAVFAANPNPAGALCALVVLVGGIDRISTLCGRPSLLRPRGRDRNGRRLPGGD